MWVSRPSLVVTHMHVSLRFAVGGEKGDAFIHFSSDDDARQAMVKSGNIYGNPIKLFLSSRSEMQTVINQARATPVAAAKPPSTIVEPSYSLNLGEQQDNNGIAASKLPSISALSSMLAEFQAKANQQQMQQSMPMIDSATTNALIMAAMQSGSTPLAIQQLLAALGEKPQQSLGQPFPFPMPHAMQSYPQPPAPSNGWAAPQVILNRRGSCSVRRRHKSLRINDSPNLILQLRADVDVCRSHGRLARRTDRRIPVPGTFPHASDIG